MILVSVMQRQYKFASYNCFYNNFYFFNFWVEFHCMKLLVYKLHLAAINITLVISEYILIMSKKNAQVKKYCLKYIFRSNQIVELFCSDNRTFDRYFLAPCRHAKWRWVNMTLSLLFLLGPFDILFTMLMLTMFDNQFKTESFKSVYRIQYLVFIFDNQRYRKTIKRNSFRFQIWMKCFHFFLVSGFWFSKNKRLVH